MWGSTPPKEMERSAPEREIRWSPPAAPVAEEREEQSEGTSEWVWGRRNSPCPRYNPQPAPHSGSTALEGGSTARSGSTALEGGSTAKSGSTASATTRLLDQRLMLKKKRKARPKEREDRRGNTHTHTTEQKQLKHKQPHETEQALASLRRGRWPEPPMFESIGMAPRRIILGPMTKTRL